MREILKENFDAEFPNIKRDFENATFFAIDHEFSGIVVIEDLSRFDTIDERYKGFCQKLQNYISLQVGITALRFHEEENTFEASTYCFYIFPQSFGALDIQFLCKTSSFEFLRQHNFDFKKLVYHGIPFLSHQQEKELRNYFFLEKLEHDYRHILSIDERKKIENACSEISVQLASLKSIASGQKKESQDDQNSKEGRNNVDYKVEGPPVFILAAYQEIHQRFPELIIQAEDYGLLIKLQSPNGLPSPDFSQIEDLLKNKIIDSMRGYTRVFDLLIELKKPIIGHNMFVDLLMMFKQFHGPLPGTLKDFKKEVLSLFPMVYDTKHMCHELRRQCRDYFRKEKAWKSSCLEGIYNYFQEGFKILISEVPCPSILASGGISAEGMYHNAGWDSYCAGHIFIRMLHLSGVSRKELNNEKGKPNLEDYLLVAKQYRNRVNIISGNVYYIALDDVDPTNHRPPKIYVCSRNKRQLNIAEVAKLCSSYGKTDVKVLSESSGLVAVGGKRTYRNIMKNLKNHPDFKLERYSVVKHNTLVRFTLWSTLMVAAGTSVALFFKILNLKN